MTGMADEPDLALTKDEQGDAVEDGAHVGQQPHANSQLWRKHIRVRVGVCVCVSLWDKSSTTPN